MAEEKSIELNESNSMQEEITITTSEKKRFPIVPLIFIGLSCLASFAYFNICLTLSLVGPLFALVPIRIPWEMLTVFIGTTVMCVALLLYKRDNSSRIMAISSFAIAVLYLIVSIPNVIYILKLHFAGMIDVLVGDIGEVCETLLFALILAFIGFHYILKGNWINNLSKNIFCMLLIFMTMYVAFAFFVLFILIIISESYSWFSCLSNLMKAVIFGSLAIGLLCYSPFKKSKQNK